MFLSELVSLSRRVAATAPRLEKVGLLASLLRRLEPREAEIGAAYLAGRLRQGRIGLGWTVIQSASGEEAAGSGAQADEPGGAAVDAALQMSFDDPAFGGPPLDLPAAPPSGVSAARAPALKLLEVDEAFARIARLRGRGSILGRTRLLAALFGRAAPDEREFLVRLLSGELRQGALAGLMEEAIAAAAGVAVGEIRRAAMLSGDLGEVARVALSEGQPGLAQFRLRVFSPLQPMLAQAAEDLEDALRRLGEAALEYKLDGARVQVHKSGSEVRIFSRRLNDVTAAIPELVEAVRALPVREIVLDGEVVAMGVDGIPRPFQVTMRRFGRRLEVEQLRGELPLTPFFFDVLSLEGQDLFDAPRRERFAALIQAVPGWVIPHLVTADHAEAERFLDQALDRGHEGVMAKSLLAPYEAGSRGFSWLKVKPAHTLDLAVLAAEWGHGRRSGWLSNLHLGARDPASGGFVMLGKTFKGMTDPMLEWQTGRLQQLAVATDGHTVHVRPELVVEVLFGDVQQSPQYPAGMALRFARIRRYREDKTAAEADTLESVRAILRAPSARRDRRGAR